MNALGRRSHRAAGRTLHAVLWYRSARFCRIAKQNACLKFGPLRLKADHL